MTRLCNILSSSLSCLGVVLLVLGVLSVSPSAWGDNPGSCNSDNPCDSGYYCDYGEPPTEWGQCVAITACGGGNPACALYVTSTDCYPGVGQNNNCNANTNCNCRWRLVNNADKCVCQNTTGN